MMWSEGASTQEPSGTRGIPTLVYETFVSRGGSQWGGGGD